MKNLKVTLHVKAPEDRTCSDVNAAIDRLLAIGKDYLVEEAGTNVDGIDKDAMSLTIGKASTAEEKAKKPMSQFLLDLIWTAREYSSFGHLAPERVQLSSVHLSARIRERSEVVNKITETKCEGVPKCVVVPESDDRQSMSYMPSDMLYALLHFAKLNGLGSNDSSRAEAFLMRYGNALDVMLSKKTQAEEDIYECILGINMPAQRQDVKEEQQEKLFLNVYECSCGATWQDEWDCACDDRCPDCNTAISPVTSIDQKTGQAV